MQYKGMTSAAALRAANETFGEGCKFQRLKWDGPKGLKGQIVLSRLGEVLATGWIHSEVLYIAGRIKAQTIMRELSKIKNAATDEEQRLAAADAEAALAGMLVETEASPTPAPEATP